MNFPTDTKVSNITCRGCQKNIYLGSFQYDVNNCDKKQCWLKTQKARKALAQETHADPEDFLLPESGEVKFHEEPKQHAPVVDYGEHGRWLRGRWVPWGQNLDDQDGYE